MGVNVQMLTPTFQADEYVVTANVLGSQLSWSFSSAEDFRDWVANTPSDEAYYVKIVCQERIKQDADLNDPASWTGTHTVTQAFNTPPE